jgi:phytoene dehydrogenase-like protein
MNQPSKKYKERSYDVVVIGAGNGGLVAAARVAMKGAKVLLLEQHNLPGGFASSFVRGRFEFETSLHELYDYNTPANKGGIRILFEDRLNIDAEFVPIPEAYRLIVTNPDEIINAVLPFGIDEFINAVEKEVPGSKDSVKRFFQLGEEIDKATSYIGKMRGNPDQDVLLREYTNFLRTAAYPVDDVQDALNIPKKARAILNAYWLYLGVPTSRVNTTVFASMVYGYILKGAYIPKMRSHEYTSAIEAKIGEYNGDVEYNTKVEKILVENNQVIGVQINKGEIIYTNHIISNASPTLVYNKLIYPKSEVPEIAFKEINARTHGVTTIVVYMGIDTTAEKLGLQDYSYFICDTMDTDYLYDSLITLEVPKVQATLCLNNAIPDCSPPGTCIISITSAFRPGAWDNVKPEDYFDLKTKIADGLIDKFEKATGAQISNHIEEIEVATPQTFSRFTGTYNGVIYGYELESWDSIIPRLQNMNDEKHIKGLEFCGGFGKRGHGYSSSLKDGETAALFTIQSLMNEGVIK